MLVVSYLLYGDSKIYERELALSVLSAITRTPGTSIDEKTKKIKFCLISDRSRPHLHLPLDQIIISPEEFSSWTSNGNYYHRAKPHAVLKALERHKCPILFADCDTIFLTNPEVLFSKITKHSSLMHACEGKIGSHRIYNHLLAKINKYKHHTPIEVTESSIMFNSGIIGIHHNNKSLVSESLNLIDSLYKIEAVFSIEQLSISLALSKKTAISSCNELVTHYWGIDREFIHAQTKEIFDDNHLTIQDRHINNFTKTKFGAPSTSIIKKILCRAKKYALHWDDQYHYAYLCYLNAIDWQKKNTEYSSAWIRLTLKSLKKSKIAKKEIIKKDFSQLAMSDSPLRKLMGKAAEVDWIGLCES